MESNATQGKSRKPGAHVVQRVAFGEFRTITNQMEFMQQEQKHDVTYKVQATHGITEDPLQYCETGGLLTSFVCWQGSVTSERAPSTGQNINNLQ